MVENQTEAGDLSSVQGAKWKAQPGRGVQRDVEETLDTELDAYLDRELFVQPTPEAEPSPAAEKSAERLQSVLSLAAEEEQWLRTLPPPDAPAENSKDLDGGECLIPEHLKPTLLSEVELSPPAELPRMEASWTPQPASLPGLATAPHLAQPGWNLPVAPVAAPSAPNRTLWVVSGLLVGVSTASLLVAGMLWMVRNSLPDRAQVVAAYVPAGTVTAVLPPPATPVAEPVLSVRDSPLSRQPEVLVADWHAATEGTEGALPGPVVSGHMSASHEPPAPAPAPAVNPEPQAQPTPEAIAQAAASPEPQVALEPAVIAQAVPEPSRPVEAMADQVTSAARSPGPRVASVKAEPVKPLEAVPLKRAPAVQERRIVLDPSLEDTQEETPFMPQPVVARAAPVAKAEPPPAAPEKSEYDEFDKDFARELGFTKGSVHKAPESKGVKSVWIPPAPGEQVQERLTPEDIQKVVVANQPAIASCIRRHKEAIPGLSGGKFMVRWFVHPDGSTYGAAVEAQALRGTALGTCIEGLVKDWKFPKHQTQMEGPIRFPFIF